MTDFVEISGICVRVHVDELEDAIDERSKRCCQAERGMLSQIGQGFVLRKTKSIKVATGKVGWVVRRSWGEREERGGCAQIDVLVGRKQMLNKRPPMSRWPPGKNEGARGVTGVNMADDPADKSIWRVEPIVFWMSMLVMVPIGTEGVDPFRAKLKEFGIKTSGGDKDSSS